MKNIKTLGKKKSAFASINKVEKICVPNTVTNI